MTRFARAALVGCGMVGGSLMAALRAQGAVERVVGFDRERAHAGAAQARGLVDELARDAATAARGADLVVIAVPVRATADVLAAIADAVADAALVTDVGSTKRDVVDAADATPFAARFCGAHPMAGTEKSGPEAADAALFRGKLAIVTPGRRTSEAALRRAVDAGDAAAIEALVARARDGRARVMR